MLLNVGPRHDGIIDPLQQERLGQLGGWLDLNGEAGTHRAEQAFDSSRSGLGSLGDLGAREGEEQERCGEVHGVESLIG